MTLLVLADNVAGTAAAQTSVDSADTTPFITRRVVEAYIIQNGMTGTVPSITIQSSPDNSVWTTVLTLATLGGGKFGNVTCERYMRANVATAAGTLAGRYSAFLRASD